MTDVEKDDDVHDQTYRDCGSGGGIGGGIVGYGDEHEEDQEDIDRENCNVKGADK